MASQPAFSFDNFLPGFDFLKKFAQANPAATMPSASQWVAPTLDPEELDKRIKELKSVQFWLDQNAKALSATIQAMEVQRMTLSTLQSMNVGMADVAAAMTGQATAASTKPASKEAPPMVDPMQWWGAISQQFQTIAAQAVEDMQKHAAHKHAAPAVKPAVKTPAKKPAKSSAKSAVKKTAAHKAPVKKAARKTVR
jgi:hypothetical protein